jgi:hypothetical protein
VLRSNDRGSEIYCEEPDASFHPRNDSIFYKQISQEDCPMIMTKSINLSKFKKNQQRGESESIHSKLYLIDNFHKQMSLTQMSGGKKGFNGKSFSNTKDSD